MIVIKNLSVCMITCWYHNVSMANHSENLINAFMRKDVSVQVVTSHCVCKRLYRAPVYDYFTECINMLMLSSFIPNNKRSA